MASRRGYAAKKAKGQHIGSIPWGYRRVDGARLEPIAPQLAVRLLAWRLYATGDYTHATLAADLNGRGHRIDYRGTDRPFTRFTVTEILRSRFDLKLGGLERDVYDRALEVAARHRINEHVGQRRHEYLFAGLARCAECGESYWGRTQVTKAGLRRRQLVHAPRGCRRGMPSEERLERIVGAWLATWRLPADARARVARYLRRSTSDAVRDAERSRVEAELERLRKMFRWGDVGEDEYRRESSRLRARLGELGPQRIEIPPGDEALRLASRIGLAWSVASLPARRTFLREWVAEVLIRRDGILDVVPRPAVAAVVFAAQMVGTVGDAGFEPATSAM